MATKPTVRIPLWGTNHAPAVAGSGNSPQGTNPKITPDAALIQAGFQGPPTSPDYEIVNELFGNGGEWHAFFAALFDNDGKFTGDSTHGALGVDTDTAALVRFLATNNNGGANVAELAADRLGLAVDNRLEAVAAGRMRHAAAAAERRFEAHGFGPELDEPAGSSFSSRAEGLYRHNLIKGKALLVTTGGSGSYGIQVTNLGAGDLSYNIASASMNASGVCTLNFTDSLDNGTFRQLFFQPFDVSSGNHVFKCEQLNPISSATQLFFQILVQPIGGGAWSVLTPSTVTASLGTQFINVMVM